MKRVALFLYLFAVPVFAQGPSPESAPPLFPGGALFSVSSAIASNRATGPLNPVQPTFRNEIPLTLAWSMRRDLQFTAVTPVIVSRFEQQGGTGLGDLTLSLKYRFLRLDSERGTTQASIAIGPKLPTGRTDLKDASGSILPVEVQPGTGSTDLFTNLSWTYTGLFNIKKLVADVSADFLFRSQGAQETRLGNSQNARFWLSYRPYQQSSVGREWWLGPTISWQRSGRDERFGMRLDRTGSHAWSLGATTYVSPAAGVIFWLGADMPVAQNMNGATIEMKHRVSFGMTKQFLLH